MHLSYFEAIQALSDAHVLLIARHAFSSEEELRQHYPPNENEHSWAEKIKPWYQKRRHLYVICKNSDDAAQYLTSSAEPDKTSTLWTLKFCSDNEPLTQLDIKTVLSQEDWNKYNAAAILLSKKAYSSIKIASVILSVRNNLHKLAYSLDQYTGYDCQTATRDVLQAANPNIDAKELALPLETDILAYKSKQSLCSYIEYNSSKSFPP